MKKIIALFCVICCLMLGSVYVFAADTEKDDEYSSTNITVSFKTGTGNYSVDGKNVKGQASELINGRTFVPVNIITDALNATLTVDLKKKTATINYNDVNIVLTADKKEAIIANKKVKIDQAPYIKNSSFMVAISFLADTLGADIKNDKGQINFVKEIANPNSIKDFSTLVKKTTKDKIGDSYYKWSMYLPSDLKLDYRNFNGTVNEFYAQDGSYMVDVRIFDTDETSNIDKITDFMLDYTEDFTLIDYGTDENGSTEYVEFIYKDDVYTYQDRYYITKNKEYNITVYTLNEDSYIDDKYQNIINSFKFEFSKDSSTEDLSDVTKDGYRKYQDTRLKWSINMHPDWRENKDDKIQNIVRFNGKNGAYFSVSVYSLEKGETLESITADSVKESEENLNPSLYNLIKQENTSIGGVACTKIYYSFKILDETSFGCEVNFVDKNYKYILNSIISEDDYNSIKQRELVDGIINSFRFKELDAKKIGKLLDPDNIPTSKKTQNISNNKYSFDIPSNWSKVEDTASDMVTYGKDPAYVLIGSYDNLNYSLSDFAQGYDETFEVGENFKKVSKTVTQEVFGSCYNYVYTYESSGQEIRLEVHIFKKGNTIYNVTFLVDNLLYGSKNADTFNSVWSSFKLK